MRKQELLSNLLSISGPKLPIRLVGSKMVTSTDGEGVIVVGGYTQHMIARERFSNLLFQLRAGKNYWIEMQQKLKYGRKDHVVIPLPRSLSNVIIKK